MTSHAERRILIVDNTPLVRRGLTALLENEPDITVSAAVGSRAAALEALAACRPDLVIADPSLEDDDGLDLVTEIRSVFADLPVLVLSAHDAKRHAERALRAGASGYATKQESSETLLIAIRRVLNGEEFVNPMLRRGHDED